MTRLDLSAPPVRRADRSRMARGQPHRRVRVGDAAGVELTQISRAARRVDGAAGAADGAAVARRGDRLLQRLAARAGVQRISRHDSSAGTPIPARVQRRAVPAVGVSGRGVDAREEPPAAPRREHRRASATRCSAEIDRLSSKLRAAARAARDSRTDVPVERRGSTRRTKDPRHHRVPPTARSPEVFFSHDGRVPAADVLVSQHDLPPRAGARVQRAGGSVEPRDRAMDAGAGADRALRVLVGADRARQDRREGRAAGRTAAAAVGRRTTVRSGPRRAAAAPRISSSLSIPQEGAEPRSAVNTLYPWAPPSGRNALVAFTGLFLVTGRAAEGKSLLRSLAAQIDQGVLPSEFPEDGTAPLYNGADTSLWFANALHDYHRYTGDDATARELLDVLVQIIRARTSTAPGSASSRTPTGCSRARPTCRRRGWTHASASPSSRPAAGAGRAERPVAQRPVRRREPRDEIRTARAVGPVHRAGRDREAVVQPQLLERRRGVLLRRDRRRRQAGRVDPPEPTARGQPAVPGAGRRAPAASVSSASRADLLTPCGVRTLATSDPDYHPRYTGNVVSRDPRAPPGLRVPVAARPAHDARSSACTAALNR